MEQTERQKKMAGHCALDMCGSIACARIRSTMVKDLNRFYPYREYRLAEARQRGALVHEPWGDAHCGFQDVCKRLEMVVRLRDLDMLSNEMDNRAYHRNERMGVCDAGTDDHERKELEVDASGERSDDSHGCNDAWDSMGDTCLELWAGAGDLVGRGTNLENEERRVRLEEVGYWPAEKESIDYSFENIKKMAMEDMRKCNENCMRIMFGLPLID